MGSGPITSWQTDRETVEAVADFILGGSKSLQILTVAMKLKDTCSFGRKVITNLDSILKSRHYFANKGPSNQNNGFPAVTGGCENCAIKEAEHWRLDTFNLWCWRRVLRVPWTVRRSNQCILKEISLEYSLEGLMLKLKLQFFGHLIWWTVLFVKTLMLGKIEGERGDDRGWDGWMPSPTQWTWVWVNSGNWWQTGLLQSTACFRPWGCKESDTSEGLNWLNWTLSWLLFLALYFVA